MLSTPNNHITTNVDSDHSVYVGSRRSRGEFSFRGRDHRGFRRGRGNGRERDSFGSSHSISALIVGC